MNTRVSNKIFNSVYKQFFGKSSKLTYSSKQKRESLKIKNRQFRKRTNGVQVIEVRGVKIIIGSRRIGKI